MRQPGTPRPRHRSRSHTRLLTRTVFIRLASGNEGVSPQSVRAQGGAANPDEMFHRQGAPEARVGRDTLWNGQLRHGDQIAAVEVIVQERIGTGLVFARERQSGAVEPYVVEQPSTHRGQIGNGLDVTIASPRQQPHPPAAALLAKEQDPVWLEQSGESLPLA